MHYPTLCYNSSMETGLDILESKKQAKIAIVISLLVLVIYKIWKFSLREFGLHPLFDYYTYEFLSSVYRTLGAFFCGGLAYKLYKKPTRRVLYKNNYNLSFAKYLPFAFLIISILIITKDISILSLDFLFEVLINIPVGFFEELSFRALLFVGLCAYVKKGHAIIISSFIFSLWHFDVGPQTFTNYFFLFMVGVTFSLFYLVGTSLLHLSLFHSIYDMIVIGLTSDLSIGELFNLHLLWIISPVVLVSIMKFYKKRLY